MAFDWLCKLINFFKRPIRIFIFNDENQKNTQNIIETVNDSIDNAKVDVFTDCRKLFYTLNNKKNFYDAGVVDQNSKKNTRKILSNMVNLTNPKLKIIEFTDKYSLRLKLKNHSNRF